MHYHLTLLFAKVYYNVPMKKIIKELYGVGILFFYFFKWPYFLGFPILYNNGLNQNFICVIVNASHKHSYPIELYYSTIFPTLFFVNANEQFIAKPIYGTIDSSSFAKKMKSI